MGEKTAAEVGVMKRIALQHCLNVISKVIISKMRSSQPNLALFRKVRRTLPWLEPRGSGTGNAAALAKHIELSLKVVQV